MQRIIVKLEGNLSKMSKEEYATEDSIIDTLSHELYVVGKDYGFETFVDDVVEICDCDATDYNNEGTFCNNCNKEV